MTRRQHLPNRRPAVTMNVEHNGVGFRMTAGHYDTGELGEIFLNAHCADSTFDAFLGDAAILCSQLLQRGCTLAEIRHSLKRDSRGNAASPIGAALDAIANPAVIS
jgi:hypothetical protein